MQERIPLDWQDLHFFLAVLRAGSLTTAAQRLRVNPSTVGRRLRALEEEAGVRLFDRTPDGYRLTALGETLVPAAERLEADAFAVERALVGLEPRIEGTVRLTATEGVGRFFVVPALRDLRVAHPGIEMELTLDNRTLSLSRREADLALRLGRPRQEGLVARRLGEIASTLYASPGYLAERGRPSASGDLRGHQVLAYDETLAAVPESRWMAQHGRSAACPLRTNSGPALLQAAQAGLGLALLPCYIADGVGLVRALPLSAGIRRELWLAVHADLQHVARIRAVIDFLVARAKASAGAFGGKGDRLTRTAAPRSRSEPPNRAR